MYCFLAAVVAVAAAALMTQFRIFKELPRFIAAHEFELVLKFVRIWHDKLLLAQLVMIPMQTAILKLF